MANQISLRIGHGKKNNKRATREAVFNHSSLSEKKKKMAATHTHTKSRRKKQTKQEKKQLKPRIYIFKK